MAMSMKRKGVGQVNDDFSDFSLSPPAKKIRRQDAELPPIVEEEEPEVPLVYEQPIPDSGEPLIEELPSTPVNQERAIVLFKPVNSPPFLSPSSFSLTVDSDIISGIKNQLAWPRQSDTDNIRSAEEEATSRDQNSDRLAVVAWVPSQFPTAPNADVSNMEAPQLMEAEEMGEASMDIDEDNSDSIIDPARPTLHQWLQQHYLIPQLPQKTSTPVTWTR